ncbi:MAG: hypothetical protein HYW07_06900 [Candidatus Latescibacteria bacterium]|nr:hypothetical protein [Candidatus Latescibacterota bacterium]
MTEASTPHSSPPPEQLPWGIAYLREDIQDLRQDLRENIQGVRQEIQGVRQEIQEVRQEVRILRDRVDDRYELLLKRIDSRFAWTLTTVIAVAGVIVAAIKL